MRLIRRVVNGGNIVVVGDGKDVVYVIDVGSNGYNCSVAETYGKGICAPVNGILGKFVFAETLNVAYHRVQSREYAAHHAQTTRESEAQEERYRYNYHRTFSFHFFSLRKYSADFALCPTKPIYSVLYNL